MHKQIGQWQEYDNDKIITHFPIWQVALKVAISRLKLDNAEIDGIDKIAFEKEIQSIKSSFKNLKAIKSAASNIINEANKISDQADDIKNQISDSLTNLNQLVS